MRRSGRRMKGSLSHAPTQSRAAISLQGVGLRHRMPVEGSAGWCPKGPRMDCGKVGRARPQKCQDFTTESQLSSFKGVDMIH